MSLTGSHRSGRSPRTQSRTSASGGIFLRGIQAIAAQIHRTLAGLGVARVPDMGTPFDPQVHEAAGTVLAPGQPPGTVGAVLHKGYLVDGELLRPARVLVVRAEPKNPDHRMVAECRDRDKVLGLDSRFPAECRYPSDLSEPLRHLGHFPSAQRLGSYRGITPNHSSIQARCLVEATEEACGSGFA